MVWLWTSLHGRCSVETTSAPDDAGGNDPSQLIDGCVELMESIAATIGVLD